MFGQVVWNEKEWAKQNYPPPPPAPPWPLDSYHTNPCFDEPDISNAGIDWSALNREFS